MTTVGEVYERVRAHLLRQKVPAKSGDSCFYRLDRRKCAIGCLIDDEHYDGQLEGRNLSAPVVRQAVARSLGGD